jgi:hypothetical protein
MEKLRQLKSSHAFGHSEKNNPSYANIPLVSDSNSKQDHPFPCPRMLIAQCPCQESGASMNCLRGGGRKVDTNSQGPSTKRLLFSIKISKQMIIDPIVPKGGGFFLDTPEIPVFCFLCIVNERKR